jgi:hypothetical protein
MADGGEVIVTYMRSLSLQHGASSASGWRSRPSDIEGSCEYIEYAIVPDSQQNVVSQMEVGWEQTTPHSKVSML